MQLSPDQEKAIHQIKEWIEGGDQTLTMGGYAGTGKTTIISYILKHWSKMDIAVCAFTGRAASVLRGKGVSHACTMHKLIYTPVSWCRFCRMETDTEKLPPEEEGGKPEKICKRCKQSQYLSMRFVRVPFINVDLVIVDEASMLSVDLVTDLESLANKILYVGDHGQLEPVGDDPGIMMNPTIRLEQIHRQAAGSPIIQFAHYVRTSNMPRGWSGGDAATVHKRKRASSSQLMEADVVLCGFNNTRVMVNKAIRKARGFNDPLPEPGERIICLQNDTELGIFNGLLVTVENRRTPKYGYTRYDLVDDVGERYLDTRVYQERFNQEKNKERFNKGVGLFDFGYALTVHKCVSGDTIVETEKGWSRIDELAKSTSSVATHVGPRRVSKVIKRPSGKLLRFTCKGGYQVSVTPDHRMRTWDGKDWTWIEAGDLSCGDWLRLRLGPSGIKLDPSRLPRKPQADSRAIPITIPQRLTSSIAEFFGLMVADGCIFKSGFRLAKRHEDVVDRFADLGHEIFGRALRRTSVHGTPAAELCSCPARDWLKTVGGMSPNNKFVPGCILQSTPGNRKAFLRGLFEDGTVNMRDDHLDHIEWTNSDPALVRTVQSMLLEYGIISSIAPSRPERLYIYGWFAGVFHRKIGFISQFKQGRAGTNNARPLRYRIPVPRNFPFSGAAGQNARTRGYISRYIANKLGSNDLLEFHYVRVQSIDPEEGKSYCLVVPDEGSFLQNRFDLGNSQGGEWNHVAVLEQIASSWTASRWRYTAATRAAKKLDYWISS